jgi:crotonobetainyl-CoA:carnitine CoA-transferase CaiB-like acyl-CoA transferase
MRTIESDCRCMDYASSISAVCCPDHGRVRCSQHSAQILTELGYAAQQIDRLRASGVI